MFLSQNAGKLSKRKASFPSLNDDDIATIEKHYKEIFNL
jgi:hypothetical protein